MSTQASHNQPGLVVAVVGATGAVGAVLLTVLEERGFPVSELRPLASARSVGSTVRFQGRDIEVQEALPESFSGVDFVFFAATGSLSRDLAPEAVKRGAVVIDKSSTWRMDPTVPLVVPEVNAEALESHHGIIACPNCTTIGFVMALEPLRQAAGLASVVVTTLQAVSGAGLPGNDELNSQQRALLNGEDPPAPVVFAKRIAANAVPWCGNGIADGYTDEEAKLLHESRKILGIPDLRIAMTCVRVPVEVGHSASVLVETIRPLTVEDAEGALRAFPGVEVSGPGDFPTPAEVEGSDSVLVGRVRAEIDGPRLWFWQVSDNLRKGAATNAVQIAEAVVDRRLLPKWRIAAAIG